MKEQNIKKREDGDEEYEDDEGSGGEDDEDGDKEPANIYMIRKEKEREVKERVE